MTSAAITTPRLPPATLEPVRFGEFLRDRNLITEEQWIAALADHWSGPRRRIGNVIVENGFLPREIVEAEARAFHEELDVVEVAVGEGDDVPRSEKPTLPAIPVGAGVPAF